MTELSPDILNSTPCFKQANQKYHSSFRKLGSETVQLFSFFLCFLPFFKLRQTWTSVIHIFFFEIIHLVGTFWDKHLELNAHHILLMIITIHRQCISQRAVKQNGLPYLSKVSQLELLPCAPPGRFPQRSDRDLLDWEEGWGIYQWLIPPVTVLSSKCLIGLYSVCLVTVPAKNK